MGRDGYFLDSHKNHCNGQIQNLDKISLFHLYLKAPICPVQTRCINRYVVAGGLVFNFSHQKHLGPQFLPKMSKWYLSSSQHRAWYIIDSCSPSFHNHCRFLSYTSDISILSPLRDYTYLEVSSTGPRSADTSQST